ncbi:MAG: GlcG/HbpS family heme-binding protein [Xanthobacteraceae bacterium]
MSGITLAQASTIADVALKKGRELNLKPLVVSILDAGGHHVVYKREDKSPILRFQIATGKAYGALGMGMGSRGLFERSQKNPMFVQMLGQLSGGRVMGVPGGVLILDAAGDTIGAVGISGDTSDNDETCALAGIEAAGLKAETGLGKG